MELSPAVNGFLKGLVVAVLGAAAAYLSDPAHLTIFSGTLALIIAGIASAVESAIKDASGRGLFGATRVR